MGSSEGAVPPKIKTVRGASSRIRAARSIATSPLEEKVVEMPTSMGADYTTAFRAIYPGLAKKNDAVLIPFLLEGVGGDPKLNLPDGVHPTAEGHALVAETVWKTLRPLLAP